MRTILDVAADPGVQGLVGIGGFIVSVIALVRSKK
jgi:hypothetical protein